VFLEQGYLEQVVKEVRLDSPGSVGGVGVILDGIAGNRNETNINLGTR